MKSLTRRRRVTAGLTYLVLLIALLFFILPMLWIAYSSFRTEGAIFTGQVINPASGYTLENYQTIFTVTDFPRYFLNSIEIASIVTGISLVVAIIASYSLSRFNIWGKNELIIGIFATQMFPPVLLIIPLYLVIFSLGLLDTIVGVAMGQMILVLPFQVWMLTGYVDGLPAELDEAAKIDGANILQRLIYVILPLALPGISVAAFYSFVVSWGNYLIVSVISESNATTTVPLALVQLSESLLVRWGEVSAATVVTIVPTILLFSFVQTRLVTGLTAGAIKQ
jgi:ABC-type glycerol-3-phosphate transport system permease component